MKSFLELDILIQFIFIVVLVNYFLGVLKAVGRGFDYKIALNGLGEVIKKEIVLAIFVVGYFWLKEVEVLGIIYSVVLLFIASLSTVYHANSAIINGANMLGLEDVAVLDELDHKFKELKQKKFFAEGSDIEGVG